jgi:hypothetical protein
LTDRSYFFSFAIANPSRYAFLADSQKAPTGRSKTGAFMNARGVKMHVRELMPPSGVATKAMVVFFHTLGEHTGRLPSPSSSFPSPSSLSTFSFPTIFDILGLY